MRVLGEGMRGEGAFVYDVQVPSKEGEARVDTEASPIRMGVSSDVPTRRDISSGISLVWGKESVGLGCGKLSPLPQGPSLTVKVFPVPGLGRPGKGSIKGKLSPNLSSAVSCPPPSSDVVMNTPIMSGSNSLHVQSDVIDGGDEIRLVPEIEAWVVSMT